MAASTKFSFCVTGVFGALAMIYGGMAQAANLTPEQEQELKNQINEQAKLLEVLRQQVAEQDAKLAQFRKALGMDVLGNVRGAGLASAQPQPKERLIELAQASPSSQPAASSRSGSEQSSGGKPAAVAQIFEQPGVLTPRGKFVFEPGLQYGYSSSNRVSLVGYTIIPALHIGVIDVREVKRNTFTANLTGRYGITNRFEIEAKLPYVHRSDSVISRPAGGGATDTMLESTGKGIGDIEVTGRYQLNDGGLDKPYYVGTLRFKSRTGKDPFEVLTDNTGAGGFASNELQRELPTGSGFYTLQPGLTVLYPTDPAVFFGGLSYQYNFKRNNVSMNTTNPSAPISEIQPGGVLGFNFGMGLSLNDRSSFSIGYDHASVGKTKINGGYAINSVRNQLGTLLVGYSQRINPTTSLNVSLGAGITRDTPDLTLSVRLPMSF